MPPYVILHDAILLAIASAKPANRSALAAISGIGEKKHRRFALERDYRDLSAASDGDATCT
jgi:superfamily II DNA helicase RecQ